MRRIGIVVLIIVAAAAAARGVSSRPALETYLRLQRQVAPFAVVTGGFYDWRTVSRYRSQAGLHLGYDVAMPAGTGVVAGWTGQVVQIAPWSDGEWGITVNSPDGYSTTYGHLRPRVRVGDVLNAGDVVGLVAIDHVDLKMRAPDGSYVDFGGGSAVALAPPPDDGAMRARLLATLRREMRKDTARLASLRADEALLARDHEAGAIAASALRSVQERREAAQRRLEDLRAALARARTSSAVELPRREQPAGEVNEARAKAEEADEMYEAGAISRLQRDRLRTRYEALRSRTAARVEP